ncbi:3'-5' exonuclease [Leptospirillum ferriphilum]|uniref:3'-5' exonuclease n=1 Tax=Leptospirillum ferriphilum TaxID=178606 RepID=UPI0006B1A892|nr:3'-5' exonuclease [Leptospirillum ferriphilum]
MKVTFLDVETTGLLRDSRARIIELGFSSWENGKLLRKTSTLIKGADIVPDNISKINGITTEMLKDAPKFEEVWKSIKGDIQGSLLVAHNLAFDVGMVNRELILADRIPLGNMGIDTLPLSRKMLPELSSYRLGEIAKHMGILNENPHRAMGDLETLEKIVSNLLGSLPGTFDEGVMRLFCLWGGYPAHRYFRDVVQCAFQKKKKISVLADFSRGLQETDPIVLEPLHANAVSLIGEHLGEKLEIPFDRILSLEIEGLLPGEVSMK